MVGELGTRRAHSLLLLVSFAALVLVLLTSDKKAAADVEASGTWNVVVSGDLTGTCVASTMRLGTTLTTTIECGSLGSGNLSGTFVKETGGFTLDGSIGSFAVRLAGVIAPEGDSLFGSWTSSSGLSGTFAGERKVATPTPTVDTHVPNMAGDWNVRIDGTLGGTCLATTDQEGAAFVTDISCDNALLGSGVLAGTIRGTGQFLAEGVVGGFDIEVAGTFDESAQSIVGTWTSSSSNSGTFSGSRKSDSVTPTASSTPSPTAQSNLGDVDCSGTADSVDAALMLQLAAQLILFLPCPDVADVNADDLVDPLDAALVIQLTAGLISALPFVP